MSAEERGQSTEALALAEEVDSLCDRYEKALKRGDAGPLDAWLPAGGAARAAALVELVRLEMEHRARAGEAVRAEDYCARYPELRGALHGPPTATAAPRPEETVADSSAAAAGPWPAGQFGRYRIVKVLGQGGMGTVYHALDTLLDRPVALKVLRFGAGDAQQVERFVREARLAASFTHPHLCPVYDFGQTEGVHYLTMPLIGGEPLSAFLRREGRMPGPAAARLAATVARAVHAAHQTGVLHRDLKPANVMLNERGEPVVTDFGLARRFAPLDAGLTAPGVLLGTPAYLPPEQITGDPETGDATRDVYSLGVMLYEMLTARLPFDGAGTEFLAQVLTRDPPPPSSFHPGLDPRLERVCLTAMARDPKARFPNMEAFADALDACVTPAPPGRPVSPPRRRRLWPIWLLVGAAAVVLGAAGWFSWPRPGPVASHPAGPPKPDAPAPAADPFQAGTEWVGALVWGDDPDPRSRRPVRLVVTKRDGPSFEGEYTDSGGNSPWTWGIQGEVQGTAIRWTFAGKKTDDAPDELRGRSFTGELADGDRLTAHHLDKERGQGNLSLRRK